METEFLEDIMDFEMTYRTEDLNKVKEALRLLPNDIRIRCHLYPSVGGIIHIFGSRLENFRKMLDNYVRVIPEEFSETFALDIELYKSSPEIQDKVKTFIVNSGALDPSLLKK